MKSVIFIHIGFTKTGSTAIQKFLVTNRDLLLKQNLLFPKCTITANNSILTYYSVLKDHPFKNTHFWSLDEIIEFPQKLKQEIMPHIESGKNIILSNEALCIRLRTKVQFERLKKIFRPFKNHIVKIVVYLRRQDEHIISAHSTLIKMGKKTTINFDDIDNSLCYDLMLDRFANFFGKENIIAKIYNKENFVNGNLINDFLSTVGVQMDPNFKHITKQNESFDTYQIQFFELLNKYKVLSPKSNSNYIFHADLLSVLSKNASNEKFKPDPEKRLKFLNKYKASNERLRQKYFPFLDNSKSLFEEIDLSNKNYKHNKLTAEKAVEIAASILKHKDML